MDGGPDRPDHVYLSDFGLSKGTLSVGLTGSGHFLGTPGYSAPEQIQGRPVDGRADQYALACTAFELLSGAAVFPRDEVLAMMYAHLSEPPPTLTIRRPGTPAAADAVFARALAKQPADRYPSCREFADALRGTFGLPAYHFAHETGNGSQDGALFPSAEAGRIHQSVAPGRGGTAGSWPATEHRARHARAPGRPADPAFSTLPPSQQTSPKAGDGNREAPAAAQKASVTRRTVLGLAAATTAGLVVTGWELSRRATTPRHPKTPTHPGPRPGTLKWTTPIPGSSAPGVQSTVQAVADGVVYCQFGTRTVRAAG